jgi:hypothetical protein
VEKADEFFCRLKLTEFEAQVRPRAGEGNSRRFALLEEPWDWDI